MFPIISKAMHCSVLYFVFSSRWSGIPFCEDSFTTDRRVLSLLASLASIRRGGVIGVVGASHTLLARSRGYLGTATATAASHSLATDRRCRSICPFLCPSCIKHRMLISHVHRCHVGSSALLLKTTSKFTHTIAMEIR